MRVGGQNDMLHTGQSADGLSEGHSIFTRRSAGEEVNSSALHAGTDLLITRLTLTQLFHGERDSHGRR